MPLELHVSAYIEAIIRFP